jgi:hypothetical protein
LGQTVENILEMSTTEFAGWAAFYKLEKEETERAMEKAKRR